ncbi:hypothetical protein TruAng_004060 [Truncatella angustata]|nr:hypothetical protein TruAng_004060 [Truncatella angustata]
MPSMPSKPRLGAAPPPPLPPPPPPAVKKAPTPPPAPTPPKLTATGLAGAFMVELVMWNGAPYKDYWAYWVRSHVNSAVGVLIHAAGDVMNGFRFEIKRHHDFRITGNPPDKRIPLQWVDKSHFNEEAMFNGGLYKLDYTPVCGFEASLETKCGGGERKQIGIAENICDCILVSTQNS